MHAWTQLPWPLSCNSHPPPPPRSTPPPINPITHHLHLIHHPISESDWRQQWPPFASSLPSSWPWPPPRPIPTPSPPAASRWPRGSGRARPTSPTGCGPRTAPAATASPHWTRQPCPPPTASPSATASSPSPHATQWSTSHVPPPSLSRAGSASTSPSPPPPTAAGT